MPKRLAPLAAAMLILAFSFLALAQPKGGRLMSEDVITPLTRGYDLLREGKYEAAQYQFEQALNADPSNPFALNNLAALKERQGKLKEAMAYLTEAQSHGADYRDKLQQTCFPGGLCAAAKPLKESGPTSMIATVLGDNVAKLRDKMATRGMLEALPVPKVTPGSCRFIVMGDSINYKYHVNRPALYYINNEILKLRPLPAFIVFLGDLAFHGGVKVWQEWLDIMRPLTNAGIKIYVAIGNHELHDVDHVPDLKKQIAYQQFFSYLPDNGPPGYKKLVYSFESGNAFFAILDSFYIDPKSGTKYKDNFTQEQLDWLANELKKTKATHKFAFSHSPAFSLQHSRAQNPSMRALWKILEDNDFDIYFAGHEHLYSRLVVDRYPNPEGKNSVIQIVAGSAGAPLTARFRIHFDRARANIHWLNNFVVVDVQGDNVSMHAHGVVKKREDDYHTDYGMTTIEQVSITKSKKK